MIPEKNKSRSWPLVYRDLCEWAVLYDMICYHNWGSDTLVIRDGLLRTKIFAGDLFVQRYGLLRAAIEQTRVKRRRDVFLVGIAKHSRVIERYRLAMAIADVFPVRQPRYVAVPSGLQAKVYDTWPEYIRAPDDDAGDTEKPKFNMGAMYLVRFGKMSADPVWTVDLLIPRRTRHSRSSARCSPMLNKASPCRAIRTASRKPTGTPRWLTWTWPSCRTPSKRQSASGSRRAVAMSSTPKSCQYLTPLP